MMDSLQSSPGGILDAGKSGMSRHETPLLGAPDNSQADETLSDHIMSKDEGLLARLGYKQGSLPIHPKSTLS